jgi:hypothetical protein
MSGAGRVERASSNDLVDLMCDLTGTSMQVAAVLVFQPLSPLDIAVVRQVIAAVPRLVDAPSNAAVRSGSTIPSSLSTIMCGRSRALHPATSRRW